MTILQLNELVTNHITTLMLVYSIFNNIESANDDGFEVCYNSIMRMFDIES